MPLRKGDLIGAYEIVAPLGQGGMATVYKAYHARLDRFVAIKMIHQAYLEDANFLSRFEREAQIVARLEHPHIVPVHDFSEHEGEPYLVMKLIEGSTLKAVLSGGELPADDILAIMTPIASALDYAHSQGVLHRDIKPSNIILDRQGTPYLTDFGLARLTISGASTLSQDLMIGTPYYMSPEQGRGKGEIDHRADLYSLGVVFYELFVGQVPFSEGTPYAIIADHVQRELPMPSSLNPNVPTAIELMLLKALAKDPIDRYQSSAEMIAAVQDAVTNEAPRIKVLSQGRQPAAESLAKQMEAQTAAQVAAESLAEQKAQQSAQASKRSVTPTRAGNQAETRKSKKTAPMPAAPQRRSWTLELSLLAVALTLIIVLVVFAINQNKANTILPTLVPTLAVQQPTAVIVTLAPRPTEPEPTLPPQAQDQPGQQRPPPRQGQAPPPVPTLFVPDMTADQARDAIARDPYNAGAYLALAKAQLQANDLAGARRTLAEGLTAFPDAIVFEMTAADQAIQIGRYDAAFLIYSDLLDRAQGAAPYPAVRATAGQFLYEAATLTDHLSGAQITFLAAELQSNSSPIVGAMIGRAFLTNGNMRLAEAAIGKALSADSSLSETHLVNGELKLANGDTEGARAEWEIIMASTGPQWVRDRATELINSLT